MHTVVTLAKQLSRAFTDRVSTETGRTIRVLAEGTPEWMSEVIRTAHGDMMPDDWRYEMIEEVCDAIADLDDDADDSDISDAVANIEPPVYTADLTRWLASRNDRYAYCDAAVDDMGVRPSQILDFIRMGWMAERDEIGSLLFDALASVAETMEVV